MKMKLYILAGGSTAFLRMPAKRPAHAQEQQLLFANSTMYGRRLAAFLWLVGHLVKPAHWE